MWGALAPASDQTWGQWRDTFLASLTPCTRISYEGTLRHFFGTVCKAPADVLLMDVILWRDGLRDRKLAPATIRARVAGLSSFYKFLGSQVNQSGDSLVKTNPAGRVKCERVEAYGRSRKMTPAQFRLILAQLPDTDDGRRDRAWMLWHAMTGRRRTEVWGMDWSKLELRGSEVWYSYVGKGGKRGTRPLPAPVVAALREWRSEWPSEGHIWGTKRGYGLALVKRLAEAAGLDPKKTIVHGMRHLAAEVLESTGASIQVVSKFLDHSSLSITEIYLERLKEQKDESVDARATLLLG